MTTEQYQTGYEEGYQGDAAMDEGDVLSAAPAGPWSLGEIDGNWRDIDLPDHGAVMRIVWKMEDDGGRNAKLEAQAHAVGELGWVEWRIIEPTENT